VAALSGRARELRPDAEGRGAAPEVEPLDEWHKLQDPKDDHGDEHLGRRKEQGDRECSPTDRRAVVDGAPVHLFRQAFASAWSILKTANLRAEPPYAGSDLVRDAITAAYSRILDDGDITTTRAGLQAQANKIFKDSAPRWPEANAGSSPHAARATRAVKAPLPSSRASLSPLRAGEESVWQNRPTCA
jgi:hypothetical protein